MKVGKEWSRGNAGRYGRHQSEQARELSIGAMAASATAGDKLIDWLSEHVLECASPEAIEKPEAKAYHSAT